MNCRNRLFGRNQNDMDMTVPIYSSSEFITVPKRSSLRVTSLSDSLYSEGLSRHKHEHKMGGTNTNTNTNTNTTTKRKVSFGLVHVRDYERIVGDNPSVTSGAPISIGWAYEVSSSSSSSSLSVHEFEESRRGLRRDRGQMIMSREVRWKLLTNEWGVPQREWVAAVRAAGRAKHRRKVTVIHLDKEEFELFLENCKRRCKKILKKVVGLGRSGKKQDYNDMYSYSSKDYMDQAIDCQQNGVLDVARRKRLGQLDLDLDNTTETIGTGLSINSNNSWENDISNKGAESQPAS